MESEQYLIRASSERSKVMSVAGWWRAVRKEMGTAIEHT